MSNHPNRSAASRITPDMVKGLREKHRLTQKEIGKLCHRTERQWQRYESGELSIDLAVWELLSLKLK